MKTIYFLIFFLVCAYIDNQYFPSRRKWTTKENKRGWRYRNKKEMLNSLRISLAINLIYLFIYVCVRY